MVHLFNITKNKDNISCDYTPETSRQKGHVVMDTKSLEIIDVKFSEYEYGKKTYVSHVRSKLEELLSSGTPLPKETISTWY